MIGGFIFLTLLFIIFSVLVYIKNHSKAELFYTLLISNIMLLFVSIINLQSNPNFFPLTIILGMLLVLLFVGVGGRQPLRTWSTLRSDFQNNYFGGEHRKVSNFTDFIGINKTIFSYVRRRSSYAILAVVITGLLFGIWFVMKYYTRHSNIGQ